MTTKQDKCVIPSDHVISSDHVTSKDRMIDGDHVIGSDHVTGSNVISNDHVTASDVTHTVTKMNSSIINIILSVDEEHIQGSSYDNQSLLILLYRPRHYSKLHIETFCKPQPSTFLYCDSRPANQIAGILPSMSCPSTTRAG